MLDRFASEEHMIIEDVISVARRALARRMAERHAAKAAQAANGSQVG